MSRPIATLAVTLAACSPYRSEPPPPDYAKMAVIAPGYLPFVPGLGAVYVEPENRPLGPYRAYDRTGKLTATIYMVPVRDLTNALKLISRESAPPIRYWQIHYVETMPGLTEPHYHITLWHVTPEEEAAIK